MAEARWCYVAQKDGRPGAAAIVMDVPGEEREVAKSVARYIRDGYTVERVPATEGVERFQVYLEHQVRNEFAREYVAAEPLLNGIYAVHAGDCLAARVRQPLQDWPRSPARSGRHPHIPDDAAPVPCRVKHNDILAGSQQLRDAISIGHQMPSLDCVGGLARGSVRFAHRLAPKPLSWGHRTKFIPSGKHRPARRLTAPSGRATLLAGQASEGKPRLKPLRIAPWWPTGYPETATQPCQWKRRHFRSDGHSQPPAGVLEAARDAIPGRFVFLVSVLFEGDVLTDVGLEDLPLLSLARIEALRPGVDSRNLAHRVTSKAMADALYERVARYGDDPEELLTDTSRWFVEPVPR